MVSDKLLSVSSSQNELTTLIITRTITTETIHSYPPAMAGSLQATGSALKLQRVLKGGEEFICSFTGTSQYNQNYAGGISNSACGLASLNFVRQVIALGTDSKSGEDVLARLIKRETMEVRSKMLDFRLN